MEETKKGQGRPSKQSKLVDIEESKVLQGEISLDDNTVNNAEMEEARIEAIKEERKYAKETKQTPVAPAIHIAQPENTLKNCLHNEIIRVKHIDKDGAFEIDKRSPLYGGMADTSMRRYVVPTRRDGRLLMPLSDDEKNFLEYYMHMEPDALSIYKKPCYWASSTRDAINYVMIPKSGIVLNLMDPEDYIRYAILRANSDLICKSPELLIKSPKPTYEFVMMSSDSENVTIGNRAQLRLQCNKLLQSYDDNKDALRTVLKIIENRFMAPRTSIEILLDKIQEYIYNNPNAAYVALSDKYLDEKILLNKALEKGVVVSSNGVYRIKDTQAALHEDYDNPNYETASIFLSKPKNAEFKYKIEELLK